MLGTKTSSRGENRTDFGTNDRPPAKISLCSDCRSCDWPAIPHGCELLRSSEGIRHNGSHASLEVLIRFGFLLQMMTVTRMLHDGVRARALLHLWCANGPDERFQRRKRSRCLCGRCTAPQRPHCSWTRVTNGAEGRVLFTLMVPSAKKRVF